MLRLGGIQLPLEDEVSFVSWLEHCHFFVAIVVSLLERTLMSRPDRLAFWVAG